MDLFHSDHYELANLATHPSLVTPLGEIERQYVINFGSRRLQRESRWYQHSSRACSIQSWISPECVLEELFVNFSPRIQSDILCRAIVCRLKVLKPIPKFEAKIFWSPGYRWFEGIGEPGEGLESRQWQDATWNVSIGTESVEFLAARGRQHNQMPPRLAEYFTQHPDDAVRIVSDSISIHLPALQPDDRCQFQFVIVSGYRRSEDDVSIWLELDQPPKTLLAAGDCD
jgi:hypothetical protein